MAGAFDSNRDPRAPHRAESRATRERWVFLRKPEVDTATRASKGRAKAVPASQGAFALVDAPEAEPKPSKTETYAPTQKASTRRTSR